MSQTKASFANVSKITPLADSIILDTEQLKDLTDSSEIVRLMHKLFVNIHHRPAVKQFFSPGRVNLIGDHIDYNGGSVFPCALTLGTYAVVAPRQDRNVSFCSLNYPQQGIVTTNLDNLTNIRADGWSNYAKGMLDVLNKAGYALEHGFDSIVFGNIPTASGLSSSASIELLYGVIARSLGGFSLQEPDNVKLSLLAQKAENEFIGVNCGIMDQFSIAMGKANQAILLNTGTLEYTYAPLNLNNLALVIANTNKKRGLADSKYNERRSECEQALNNLQKELNIKHLCELNSSQLETHKHLLQSELHYRRARHAISEQERVLASLEALSANNLQEFGTLMNASHDSLRDDYEVTGIELDTLVQSARDTEGCLGSRVTGAGFGGCTVNLVKIDKTNTFIDEVGKNYAQKIGYQASFYIVSPGEGAREI